MPRPFALPFRYIWAVLVAVLLAGPPFLNSYHLYLLNLVLTNVTLAVGLNILTGNAGLISLCQSSFMAVGAYATTLLAAAGIPYLLALAAGGALAALCGILLAVPAMRLSGYYLALATLGFLEITQILIEQSAGITGGVRGLVAPRPVLLGRVLSSDLALYYFVFVITTALMLGAHFLLRSRFGRAFDAIRLSTAAAQSIGISPAATKVTAFAISAFYAGVAGGLGAAVVGFIDPTEYNATASLRAITFIVVGGMGSLPGAALGAALLTALPQMLSGAQEYGALIYAVLLLGFLILMPRGIAGVLPRLLRRQAPDRPAAGITEQAT